MTSIKYIAVAIAVYSMLSTGWCADPFQASISTGEIATLNQAKELRLAKKYEQAIALLEKLTKSNPNYYLAEYNLALAYAETNAYAKAAAHFTEAARLQEANKIADPALFNSFGWMYLLQGDYANAEKQFKTAEKDFDHLAPESKRKLLNNTGLLYTYKRDYVKAQSYLSRAAGEFDSPLAKENLKTVSTLIQQSSAQK